MNWLKSTLEPKYLLLGIAAGLIAVHLTLTWRADNVDVLGTSFLFWGAGVFLVWEKQHSLRLDSGLFSSFLGVSIIALVLLKSVSVSGYDIFLRIFPFLSSLGLGLLASGIKGLKQYWQELLILSFIAIPTGLILRLIDVATLTAKFTGFILWYLGFDVTRQGVLLILPTGSVEVGSGCTGITSILQLLGLAMLFLLMFPTKLSQKILLPIVAVAIAFVVNAVRVGLMAYLVAYSNKEAFEYWHYGDGSLIFSMIAVGLFGLFCWFAVLSQEEPKNQDTGER